MKKIISVLFAICLCMAASAQQHMKFMGIPLDGTVDNFALKLKAKGITYDAAESKSADAGTRIFYGKFMGEKARFIVFYNYKSKIVFSAAVELNYPTVESAHTPFVNLSDQLQQKYPDATCKAYKGPDGDVDGMAMDIYDETGDNRIGFILQTLKASSSGYGISIYLTYADSDNLAKSDKILNEDL